ncbi:UNKNOWN [Stylonychia lemnae]|uniref:P-loop containing nucleoside triphosphate hydrolase n=1 Tax=Stylonychia lemnae TaxID=5949 RepID=A0A078ALE5_STYLE|nr:UNKNOWN [Stylonychia lemnae]|eukprot:CDW83180.1 UNKNOWN [Stylonychia lemnae]
MFVTNDKQVKNLPLENSTLLKRANELELYLYPDWLKIEKDKINNEAVLKGLTQNEIQNLLIKASPFSAYEEAQAKVIMVVGQTGSVNEQTGKAQSMSQTRDVNVYYVKSHQEGFPPIILVDTPGFGDNGGIQQDQIISDQIRNFLADKLDSINAICFILKIYGRDIAENFICLITFCDGGEPQVVEALKYHGESNENENTFQKPLSNSIFQDLIPQIKEPWYLKFNNSALYKNNKSGNIQIAKMYWDIGWQSFDIFMKQKIQLLPRKSLVKMKEISEEQNRIERIEQAKQSQILTGFQINETNRQDEQQFEVNNNQTKPNQDFYKHQQNDEIPQPNAQPVQQVNNGLRHNNISNLNQCKTKDNKTEPLIMSEGVKIENSYINPSKSQFEQNENLNFAKSQEVKKDFLFQIGNKEFSKKQNKMAIGACYFDSCKKYIDQIIQQEQAEKKKGTQGKIKVLKALNTQFKKAQEAYKGDKCQKQFETEKSSEQRSAHTQCACQQLKTPQSSFTDH